VTKCCYAWAAPQPGQNPVGWCQVDGAAIWVAGKWNTIIYLGAMWWMSGGAWVVEQAQSRHKDLPHTKTLCKHKMSDCFIWLDNRCHIAAIKLTI